MKIKSILGHLYVQVLIGVGLGILVGANAVIDFCLLGFAPRLPIASLAPLYRFMWAGFAMNAITGVMLFASDATTKAAQPVFYIKLTLIGLALVTTAMIRTTVTRATALPSADASRASRITRLATLSLLLWAAAITAGRLMAYL